MKKVILILSLAAFAVAVQAGDDACPMKDKACCPKAAQQAKTTCAKMGAQAKAGCCAAKQATAKASKQLASPKATSLASK